jgi:hypothetical protein
MKGVMVLFATKRKRLRIRAIIEVMFHNAAVEISVYQQALRLPPRCK